jgi:hypothetical protein
MRIPVIDRGGGLFLYLCLLVRLGGDAEMILDNGSGRPKTGSILYLFGSAIAKSCVQMETIDNALFVNAGRNDVGQLAAATCSLKDEVAIVSYPCFSDTRSIDFMRRVPLCISLDPKRLLCLSTKFVPFYLANSL